MRRICTVLLCLCLLLLAGCETKAKESDSPASQPEGDAAVLESTPGGDPVGQPDGPSIWDPYDFVDLSSGNFTDEEKLLMCMVWTGLADRSWQSAEEIDPDGLLSFFFQISNEPFNQVDLDAGEFELDEEIVSVLYPASLVDPVLQQHFGAEEDHLHSSMFYIADKDAYWFGGLGSVSNARLVDSSVDGNRHTINYELYRILEYEGSGVLTAEINSADDYRYLSNVYTPRALTAEEEALEKSFVAAGSDLTLEERAVLALIWSGNANLSWENPEDNVAADLVRLYAVLAALGEVEIPADVERDPYWKYPYVPATDVEQVVLAYFDTDAEYLRQSPLYDQDRQAYRIPRGEGYGNACQLVDTKQDGDLLTIRFQVYQNYSPHYDGEIVVELDGEGGFRYRACTANWGSR